MKFFVGLLCGLILGGVSATAYLADAQLTPFSGTLEERLDGQRAENYLKLERQLERQRYESLDPCRR